MSERGEVEAILPLTRWPSTPEQSTAIVKMAFREARTLVRPTGGSVLGVVSIAKAAAIDGDVAMKVRFAVNVPEKYLTRPKSIAF